MEANVWLQRMWWGERGGTRGWDERGGVRGWGEKDEVRGVVIKLSWEKIKSEKSGNALR